MGEGTRELVTAFRLTKGDLEKLPTLVASLDRLLLELLVEEQLEVRERVRGRGLLQLSVLEEGIGDATHDLVSGAELKAMAFPAEV